jgi:hypothetical protein
MKPTLLMQISHAIPEEHLQSLKKEVEKFGLNLLVVHDVISANIIQPPLTFRDEVVLRMVTSDNVCDVANAARYAEKVFDVADAMEAERMKRVKT